MAGHKKLEPRFKRNGDGTLHGDIRETVGVEVKDNTPIQKKKKILKAVKSKSGVTTYELVDNPDYDPYYGQDRPCGEL